MTAPKRLIRGEEQRLPFGERDISVVDIINDILVKLRNDALNWFALQGEHVTELSAVIGYPAVLQSDERERLKESAHRAEFRDVWLIEEPEAIILNYHNHPKLKRRIFVYDLGGDNLGLTIRSYDKSRKSFTPGYSDQKRFGGNSFDEAIYDYCERQAQEQLHRSLGEEKRRDLRILRVCRNVKEYLTHLNSHTFQLILQPLNNNDTSMSDVLPCSLSRSVFEKLIEAQVLNSVELSRRQLEGELARNNPVGTLLIAGGAACIPLVGRILREGLVQRFNLEVIEATDFALAEGAAYHGYQIEQTANRSPRPPRQPHHPSTKLFTYRVTVEGCWLERHLTPKDVAHLDKVGRELALGREQTEKIEIEIMGHTKEEILARQWSDEYRQIWEKRSDERRPWHNDELAHFQDEAQRIGLNDEDAQRINDEYIAELQKKDREARTRYAEFVELAAADGRLQRKQYEILSEQELKLGLNRENAFEIEREIMGADRDTIRDKYHGIIPVNHEQLMPQLEHRRLEYRKLVETAWTGYLIDENTASELVQQLRELGLTEDDAAEIEREVIGKPRNNMIEDLKAYRRLVKMAWAKRYLIPGDVDQLGRSARERGLSEGSARAIEEQELGADRATIAATKNRPLAGSAYTAVAYTTLMATVNVVAFLPNSDKFVSGGSDGQFRLWNSPLKEVAHYQYTHQGLVCSLAISPDGQLVAGGFVNSINVNQLVIWNPKSRRTHYDEYRSPVMAVVFSNSKLLASGCKSEIRLYDPPYERSNREIVTFDVRALAFSPDSLLLAASAGTPSRVEIHNLQNGDIKYITEHAGTVRCLVFHPNGRFLVYGATDENIIVWDLQADLQASRCFRKLSPGIGSIEALAFSGDGGLLATTGEKSGVISLWDALTWEPVTSLDTKSQRVYTVAFSSDSELLVSGEEKFIEIWKK